MALWVSVVTLVLLLSFDLVEIGCYTLDWIAYMAQLGGCTGCPKSWANSMTRRWICFRYCHLTKIVIFSMLNLAKCRSCVSSISITTLGGPRSFTIPPLRITKAHFKLCIISFATINIFCFSNGVTHLIFLFQLTAMNLNSFERSSFILSNYLRLDS